MLNIKNACHLLSKKIITDVITILKQQLIKHREIKMLLITIKLFISIHKKIMLISYVRISETEKSSLHECGKRLNP